MRKFSFKAPESQETIVAPAPQLSLEEEAIVLDEANQAEADVEQTSADIDQLGDIIVTMGDVQTVVSNTPEIKPIDQALVGASADAAVAGTDAEPEELVGSMLPDAGVSTEDFVQGVKDAVAKIWQSIKDAIIKIWDHIRAFFTRIGEFITGTKRRVAKLEKLVETSGDMGSYTVAAKDLYKGPIDVLMIHDHPTQAVGKDYQDLQKWVGGVVMALTEDGKKVIDDSKTLIEQFLHDPTETNRTIDRVMSGMTEATKHLGDVTIRVSDDGKRVLGGLHFTGFLAAHVSTGLFGKEDAVGALREYGSDLRLRVGGNERSYQKVDVLLTNKLDQIKLVLEHGQQYVKDVEAKGYIIAKMSEHSKSVCMAIDAAVNKHNERTGMDQEAVRVMKELFRINGNVNSMVASTLQKVITHTNRVTNGVLDYAIQSCEAASAAKA